MRALVTGTRAPAAMHQAALLSRAGVEVVTADSILLPLSRGSRLVEGTLRYPSPNTRPNAFRDWVRETVHTGCFDRVYPSCEEIFHFAVAMRELGLGNKLYAPKPDLLLRCHDKSAFCELLQEAGLPSPKSSTLRSRADLDKIAGDAANLVFKPAYSRFGEHTLIRPRQEALRHIRPTPVAPWVAQEFLNGPEICIHAFGTDGHPGGISAYMPSWRVGRGAGIYFEPVSDPRIDIFVRRFFTATGWTGHVGFDAILTESRGLIPIECNPRVTSGLHFFRDGVSAFGGMIGRHVATAYDGPLMISMAMRILARRRARQEGRLETWHRDMSRAEDATIYGLGATGPFRQAATGAEFMLRAVLGRRSLLGATTADISWSGAHR